MCPENSAQVICGHPVSYYVARFASASAASNPSSGSGSASGSGSGSGSGSSSSPPCRLHLCTRNRAVILHLLARNRCGSRAAVSRALYGLLACACGLNFDFGSPAATRAMRRLFTDAVHHMMHKAESQGVVVVPAAAAGTGTGTGMWRADAVERHFASVESAERWLLDINHAAAGEAEAKNASLVQSPAAAAAAAAGNTRESSRHGASEGGVKAIVCLAGDMGMGMTRELVHADETSRATMAVGSKSATVTLCSPPTTPVAQRDEFPPAFISPPASPLLRRLLARASPGPGPGPGPGPAPSRGGDDDIFLFGREHSNGSPSGNNNNNNNNNNQHEPTRAPQLLQWNLRSPLRQTAAPPPPWPPSSPLPSQPSPEQQTSPENKTYEEMGTIRSQQGPFKSSDKPLPRRDSHGPHGRQNHLFPRALPLDLHTTGSSSCSSSGSCMTITAGGEDVARPQQQQQPRVAGSPVTVMPASTPATPPSTAFMPTAASAMPLATGCVDLKLELDLDAGLELATDTQPQPQPQPLPQHHQQALQPGPGRRGWRRLSLLLEERMAQLLHLEATRTRVQQDIVVIRRALAAAAVSEPSEAEDALGCLEASH